MDIGVIQPKTLVKRLAGESFEVKVGLNPDIDYDVEIIEELGRDIITNVRLHRVDRIYTAEIPLSETGIHNFVVRFRKKGEKRFKYLKNKHKQKITIDVQVDPAWLGSAIVYSVFVRFFKGKIPAHEVVRKPATTLQGVDPEELKTKKVQEEADILPGEGGTFDDVKAYLDTLREMKIDVLYFNPIHVIGEIYRGYNMLDQLPHYLQPGSPYSIKDYKSIDPELTYDKDTKKHLLSDPQKEFKDLIEAAHERGMKIIMDLVFNHTAHDFVLQRIRPEWYLYKEKITDLSTPYLYPEDVKKGKPWGDPYHSVPPYDHGVFWEDCAQLNWEFMLTEAENEPPPNYSLHEMWEYFKSIPLYWIHQFGVDGFRCDVAYRVPAAFWKECIEESRHLAKEEKVNLSNDVVYIAESYTSNLKELQEAGFSAVYGDFSHKVSTPVQLKGYLDYIYNTSGQHFPDGSKWFHFPDSHDFDRTPRKVLGDRAGDESAALLANQSRWTLTATLPGIPLIFNGFEKIEWQPINIWSYGAINWERDADLHNFIAKVNEIKRSSQALQNGTYTYLHTNQELNENTQVFCYLREKNDDVILVVVNMDVFNNAGPLAIFLPEEFSGKYMLTDELTGEIYEREGKELTVLLNPGQSHIFRVEWKD